MNRHRHDRTQKQKGTTPGGRGCSGRPPPGVSPFYKIVNLPYSTKWLTNKAKEKPGRSASTSPAGGLMARERTTRDIFIIPWADTAVTLFCVHVDMAHHEGTICTA